MNEYVEKLQKYKKDEIIINDIILFLVNQKENLFLLDIEEILCKLKNFSEIILKSDLSTRKRNNILMILNKIIEFYNDMLMTQICENI